MNKMSLSPTAAAQRTAPTDLLGQLGQLSQGRGAQEGAEAAGGFARLLQANASQATRAPAPAPAALTGQTSAMPAKSPASPTPPKPAQGASRQGHAVESGETALPASTETARRQENAKAAARRPAEAQAKPSGDAAAAEGESQDPVLAQVLRHLRGEGGDASSTDASIDTSAEDGAEAATADPAAAAQLTGLPMAQTLAQDLQRLAQPAAAAEDAHTDAVNADAPSRGGRHARLAGAETDAMGAAGNAGAPLSGTAAAAAPDAAAQTDGLQALALDGAASSGKGAAVLENGRGATGSFAGVLQQVQAGVVQDKAAASGPAGARYELHAPLHSPGFAPEMAARLSVAAADGIQQAQLHLNPAEMGPVQVQIVLDGQQAQVSFVAEQADTRAALEKSLPELAGALREQGLTLSGGGVFSQQQQTASGQPGQAESQGGRPGARWASAPMGETVSDDAVAAAARAPVTRARGVLDLFA